VWNEYAREKLREIDAELRRRHPDVPQLTASREPPRVLAPAARLAGRRLRRLGEAIESWATPCKELRQSAETE
jgi:hypothetical protein